MGKQRVTVITAETPTVEAAGAAPVTAQSEVDARVAHDQWLTGAYGDLGRPGQVSRTHGHMGALVTPAILDRPAGPIEQV